MYISIEQSLSGTTIAVLVADGFEESEFVQPVESLMQAGAEIVVVSPVGRDQVKAWNGDEGNWGASYEIDMSLEEAMEETFDALLLPGGVLNPDTLRVDRDVRRFVSDFFEKSLPVAAICHAPQILIDSVELEGRRLTSYFSIKSDLENAGGYWIDQETVVDGNLLTSRSPADLPAFVEQFAAMLTPANVS